MTNAKPSVLRFSATALPPRPDAGQRARHQTAAADRPLATRQRVLALGGREL